MLWLLPSLALASGMMSLELELIDRTCAPLDASVPLRPPLYVTGLLRGTTSAPGGPSHHSVYPLDPASMTVTRRGCPTPEPGAFAVVGSCKKGRMLRYRGALAPGVTYLVGLESGGHREVTVRGTAARGGCPGDPLAFGRVDEKDWGEPETRRMVLRSDQVEPDPAHYTLRLKVDVLERALGLAPLQGPHAYVIDADFVMPDSVDVDVTVRPYRHRYEVDDDRGRVWCEEADAALVDLVLAELEMKFTLGWSATPVRSRTLGYCS